MCSVCYKSTHMNKQETPKPTAAVPAPSPEPSVAPPAPGAGALPRGGIHQHAEGARRRGRRAARARRGRRPRRRGRCRAAGEAGEQKPVLQLQQARRVHRVRVPVRFRCTARRTARQQARCGSLDFGRWAAAAKANPAVIAEKVDKVRHACFVVLFARTRERTIGFVSQTTHRSRTRRGFSRSRQTYATDVWCPFFFFLNADLTKSVSLRRGRRRRGRTRSRNHL